MLNAPVALPIAINSAAARRRATAAAGGAAFPIDLSKNRAMPLKDLPITSTSKNNDTLQEDPVNRRISRE
jgi:hypothetical protein